MYIKIIGSLFLIGSAATVGYLKSEELKERVKKLRELKRMIILLQGELRFHRAALPEAFENVSERVLPPFREFLDEMAKRLNAREDAGFDQIWDESCRKLLNREGLCKDDGQLLELLGSSLGYLDLTMQTETLNLALVQTEEAIRLAKEQQESRGKLYETMGVTAGMLLTLLII